MTWIRDNKKFFMAMFGIVLMIAFILPTTAKLGDGSRANPVRGTVNGADVRLAEYQRAHGEYEFLSRHVFIPQQVPSQIPGMPPQTQLAPLPFLLGENFLQQIQANSDMYLVLQKEAESMNVQVSSDVLQSYLSNQVRYVDENRQPTPVANLDPQRRNFVTQAVANFLRVQAAFERGASAIKPSQPLRRHLIGTQAQTITVQLAEVPVAPFEKQVPPPTTQQVDEQFKQYADVDPERADFRTNPFAFGYRYPNRVKLQYIGLSRGAVLGAAERARTKDDAAKYEWDRAAYRYYQENQYLYQTTPPTTAPAITFGAPTPGPTTRPFKEVTEQARQAVVNRDADKLATTIRQRITAAMNQDYQAWTVAAAGATRPAKPPVTSFGVTYDSFDYLQKLAESIQKQYDVLPTVASLDKDWLAASDLETLPGIGRAALQNTDPMRPDVPFAQYAIAAFEQFVPENQRTNPNVLNLMKPSPAFATGLNDLYIFRITDAQPAHAPKDKSEVLAKVEADVRYREAFKLAEADAAKLAAAARESSLATAAQAAGRPVATAGPFNNGQLEPIAGYPALTDMSRPAFLHHAFSQLLGNASDQNLHPIAVIPLPRDGKAVVARLETVQPRWTSPDQLAFLQSQVELTLQQQMRAAFRTEWFNYANLVARTDYKENGRPVTPHPNPGSDQPRPPML